jgi:hypothetical protein
MAENRTWISERRGHDLELGSWEPSQGRSKITRPNTPPAAVVELDNVTLVVPRNEHDTSSVR